MNITNKIVIDGIDIFIIDNIDEDRARGFASEFIKAEIHEPKRVGFLGYDGLCVIEDDDGYLRMASIESEERLKEHRKRIAERDEKLKDVPPPNETIIEIYGTKVIISEGISIEEARKEAIPWLQWRFERSIAIYRSFRTERPQVDFTNPAMEKEIGNDTPFIEVPLELGTGRIYLLDGITEDEVTGDILEFAQWMWHKEIFIERHEDINGEISEPYVLD